MPLPARRHPRAIRPGHHHHITMTITHTQPEASGVELIERERQAEVRSEERAQYAAQDTQLTDDEILARAQAILLRKLERGQAMTDPTTAGQYCALRLRGL